MAWLLVAVGAAAVVEITLNAYCIYRYDHQTHQDRYRQFFALAEEAVNQPAEVGFETDELLDVFNNIRAYARDAHVRDGGSRSGTPQVAGTLLMNNTGYATEIEASSYRSERQRHQGTADVRHTEDVLLERVNLQNDPAQTLFFYTENAPCVVPRAGADDCLLLLIHYAQAHPRLRIIVGFQRFYHVVLDARGSTENRRNDWMEVYQNSVIPSNLHFFQMDARAGSLENGELLMPTGTCYLPEGAPPRRLRRDDDFPYWIQMENCDYNRSCDGFYRRHGTYAEKPVYRQPDGDMFIWWCQEDACYITGSQDSLYKRLGYASAHSLLGPWNHGVVKSVSGFPS